MSDTQLDPDMEVCGSADVVDPGDETGDGDVARLYGHRPRHAESEPTFSEGEKTIILLITNLDTKYESALTKLQERAYMKESKDKERFDKIDARMDRLERQMNHVCQQQQGMGFQPQQQQQQARGGGGGGRPRGNGGGKGASSSPAGSPAATAAWVGGEHWAGDRYGSQARAVWRPHRIVLGGFAQDSPRTDLIALFPQVQAWLAECNTSVDSIYAPMLYGSIIKLRINGGESEVCNVARILRSKRRLVVDGRQMWHAVERPPWKMRSRRNLRLAMARMGSMLRQLDHLKEVVLEADLGNGLILSDRKIVGQKRARVCSIMSQSCPRRR